MNAIKPLGAMKGYLGANIRHHENREQTTLLPAISMTRQAGSRAISIGNCLLSKMQKLSGSTDEPWRLFEKDLVQYVLAQKGMPKSLSRFYPENPTPYIEDAVEEIVGLHPSSYKFNGMCHEAIIDLCRRGNVIIIGRASNLLTSDLPNTVRVRLVGSIEARTQHVMSTLDLNEREAREYIRREDSLRKRYARTNFNRSDVDNPEHYDLVLNTDRISNDSAADLISRAAEQRIEQCRVSYQI